MAAATVLSHVNLLIPFAKATLTFLFFLVLVSGTKATPGSGSRGGDQDDGTAVGASNGAQRYHLEGRVMIQQATDQEWVANTRVIVDGGQYLGLLRLGRADFSV